MLLWENKSSIPDTYFTWSDDFDYRRYLEEKSHIDEVVLAVGRSTLDIVGSTDRLTERVGTGIQVFQGGFDQVSSALNDGFSAVEGKLDQIDSRLEHGFAAISFDLNVLGNNIEDLVSICEFGFERLSAELGRSNELLDELVGLTKTPNEVWATEQYGYAKDCYTRGLWEDALGFVDKALHGDEHNSGLRIVPEFHRLRGDILSRFPDVGEGLSFLEMALASYKAAVKYSRGTQVNLKALCLQRAGWTAYCLGERDAASALILDSLSLDPQGPSVAMSKYYLAKFNVYQDVGEASEALKDAIERDELFLLRAANDSDFINSGIDIDGIGKQALNDLSEAMQVNKSRGAFKVHELEEILDLGREVNADGRVMLELQNLMDEIEGIERENTLAAYVGFFRRGGGSEFSSRGEEVASHIAFTRKSLVNDIKSKIDALISTSHIDKEASPISTDVPKGRFLIPVRIISVLLAALISYLFVTGWEVWELRYQGSGRYPGSVLHKLVATVSAIAIFIGAIIVSLPLATLVSGLFDAHASSQINREEAKNYRARQKQMDEENRKSKEKTDVIVARGKVLSLRLAEVGKIVPDH